jgi:hypothetical protein
MVELSVRTRKPQSLPVPKSLSPFIPEILSHPATVGKDKTLPVPHGLGQPVEPAEAPRFLLRQVLWSAQIVGNSWVRQ